MDWLTSAPIVASLAPSLMDGFVLAETAAVQGNPTWLERLSEWTNLHERTIIKLFASLVAILVVFVIRLLVLRVIRNHIEEIKRHYRWRRAINYVAGIIVLLIIGRIWFEGLQGFGVILGLASAGLAIALRDPLSALAGWLFILTRRPYVIGDRIQVGDTFGDVIDIRMFQTYLLECGNWIDGDQSTGRIVLIPNSSVFSTGVANFTHGFEYIWDEVHVRLTFESDWRRAKEILTEIAEEQTMHLCQDAQQQIRKAASQHLIFFQKLTPIVYTSVKEWGVQLTVRYLTPVRQRRGSSQRIWEATLEAFAKEPRIAFAYPTTRFFRNPQEGKPDLAPQAERSAGDPASSQPL